MKDLIGCGCCHWISFFVSLEFMNVVHPTDNKVKKIFQKRILNFSEIMSESMLLSVNIWQPVIQIETDKL